MLQNLITLLHGIVRFDSSHHLKQGTFNYFSNIYVKLVCRQTEWLKIKCVQQCVQ